MPNIETVDHEIIKNNKELNNFVSEVCGAFLRCNYDSTCCYAPTREPFVTLTSGGIKKEGEASKCFQSEDQAVKMYIIELYKYAVSRGSAFRKTFTLYWRHRPVIIKKGSDHFVYSRLLISDKPVDADFVRGLNNA